MLFRNISPFRNNHIIIGSSLNIISNKILLKASLKEVHIFTTLNDNNNEHIGATENDI